jgi:hypothetical protein
MYDSKEAIQQLLNESVAELSRTLPDTLGLEKMLLAFRSFKRGVLFASRGRYATPSELLQPLEPKQDVCDCLIHLYKVKKMLRRQIEAVMSVLLCVDGWTLPFAKLDVPELQALVKEMTEKENQALSEYAPQAATSSSAAVFPSGSRLAEQRGVATLGKTLYLLDQSRKQMEHLSYSAAGPSEQVIVAFEGFRGAVVLVTKGRRKDEDEALDMLEDSEKLSILEFLVDVSERSKKYRSRVASVLMRLLAFDSWRAEAENDDSVHAAVKHLIEGDTIETADRPSMVEVRTAGSRLRLRSAAEAAASRQAIGAVYVRVVGAQNLISPDPTGTPDPYVRIFLGKRMKRTDTIGHDANPRWDSVPFVMDAPNYDSVMKIQVLDENMISSDKLGNVQIRVRDLPTELESVTSRFPLSDVAHGELELELLLVLGKEFAEKLLLRPNDFLEASRASRGVTPNVRDPLSGSNDIDEVATAAEGRESDRCNRIVCRRACNIQ